MLLHQVPLISSYLDTIGAANDSAVGVQAKREKSKKNFKRVFSLLVKHKSHNKISKKKKNSTSGLLYTTNELRREVHNAAKAINGSVASEKTKKLAIKRLHRLHKANRPQIKGAKKEEQKK